MVLNRYFMNKILFVKVLQNTMKFNCIYRYSVRLKYITTLIHGITFYININNNIINKIYINWSYIILGISYFGVIINIHLLY